MTLHVICVGDTPLRARLCTWLPPLVSSWIQPLANSPSMVVRELKWALSMRTQTSPSTEMTSCLSTSALTEPQLLLEKLDHLQPCTSGRLQVARKLVNLTWRKALVVLLPVRFRPVADMSPLPISTTTIVSASTTLSDRRTCSQQMVQPTASLTLPGLSVLTT